MDRARVARGSVRSRGCAILRNEPWHPGDRWRSRNGRSAYLPAHAGARRRFEQAERRVLYDQRLRERDSVFNVWQRSAVEALKEI